MKSFNDLRKATMSPERIARNREMSQQDATPEIPEGQHGITVLVVLHDPVYESIRPGRGSHVGKAVWDGQGFKQLAHGMNDWLWVYCLDIPTHWAYLPDPIQTPSKAAI